ncbi:MAG: SPOR domain-containing protein [Crocinitomicaceae bacterium]
MELEKYIADLLRRHDCVVVPSFGGFVANYKSAEIDRFRNKIHPPSKSVLFNPHLISNDGLLGNYVAQKIEVDYPQALQLIAERVENWITAISEGGRVEIGEIGFLYQENGTIHFEQSRDVNLLLEAYGLSSIDFVSFTAKESEKVTETLEKEEKRTVIQAVKKENKASEKEVLPKVDQQKKKQENIQLNTTEEISEVKEEQTLVQQESVPHKTHPLWTVLKYTAAAAIVPILFYSYWIPMETDALETKSIQFSDFNPIQKQKQKVYSKRSAPLDTIFTDLAKNWDELTENIQSEVYNFEVTDDFYVPVLLKETTNETEDFGNTEISGKYHIISGCFSVKKNALNKISDLQSKGYSAAILDRSNGLHRVTAGGFKNRRDAKDALEKFKNSGQSGWILKK